MKIVGSIAIAAVAMAASSVHAQDSISNVSKATGDSVTAVAELSEAGVKVVAGAVAVPFVAVGAVAESAGTGIRESGQALWDGANTPLTISPETVTAQAAPQVPYDAKRQPAAPAKPAGQPGAVARDGGRARP